MLRIEMLKRLRCLILMLSVLCLVCIGNCLAQVCIGNCLAQDESKGIEAAEFTSKRPAPSKKTSFTNSGGTKNNSGSSKRLPRNSDSPVRKRIYRVVGSSRSSKNAISVKSGSKAQNASEFATIGFTLWRIRPSRKEDETKELIEVQDTDGRQNAAEYTLERLSTDAPINSKELLRFSIESLSQNGYLYVVDRERFADGSYGAPKLVFPTLRTKNRNHVSAGFPTYLPEPPKYFRLISNQPEKRQIADVITLVVSPRPLIDDSLLKINAIELSAEQVEGWEKQWRTEVTELEQVEGAGQQMTFSEQAVGKEAAKGLEEVSANLTQDDAPPQTIYRALIKRGNPVLITIVLNLQTK